MSTDQADVHKQFQHYRRSGAALSVTLTTLASGLIVWGNAMLTRLPPDRGCERYGAVIMIIFGALTIVACLTMQVCDYRGYRHQARALFAQGTQERANTWFTREDRALWAATVCFALAVLAAAVLFVTQL